uniref:Uncharacterized protein n=1 Tax=Haptolina brevifila TaxID=156173 RepID=A0A7S2I0K4_9EUKA|mmetsp:Transcript_599/g.1234  ORF Transcript_599/g.1234 Transcript_599/m.1234 type:complete len:281 (+) Transcript_599:596-1438(+)
MHVRTGDKNAFEHAGWRTKPWWMAHDDRVSPYDASPSSAFECLARLSTLSRLSTWTPPAVKKHEPSLLSSSLLERGPPASSSSAASQTLSAARANRLFSSRAHTDDSARVDDGARTTDQQSSCMRCVVLSDSPAVEECSRRVLDSPITTPGASVHLSASASELRSNSTNVQRTFLDWLILSLSAATLFTTADSTFELTAWSFKVASATGFKQGTHDKYALASWPHLQFNSARLSKTGKCEGSPGTCLLANASHAAARHFWREQCRPPPEHKPWNKPRTPK